MKTKMSEMGQARGISAEFSLLLQRPLQASQAPALPHAERHHDERINYAPSQAFGSPHMLQDS